MPPGGMLSGFTSSLLRRAAGTDDPNVLKAHFCRVRVDACIVTSVHTCTHAYVHTYLRMYACTYVHMYVRTHVLTYRHTCIHTYIRTYVRTYIHTHIHACLHKYTYIHIQAAPSRLGVAICITGIRVCMYTHMYTEACVCNPQAYSSLRAGLSKLMLRTKLLPPFSHALFLSRGMGRGRRPILGFPWIQFCTPGASLLRSAKPDTDSPNDPKQSLSACI